jgi:hypothetical protein
MVFLFRSAGGMGRGRVTICRGIGSCVLLRSGISYGSLILLITGMVSGVSSIFVYGQLLG